jgi:hypothetical protein
VIAVDRPWAARAAAIRSIRKMGAGKWRMVIGELLERP